jgi:hypothetical protein
MRLVGFLERLGIRGRRLQVSVLAIACVCLLAAIGFTVGALASSEGTPLAKGAPPVPKGEALTSLKTSAAKECPWPGSNTEVAVVPTMWAPAIATLRKARAVSRNVPSPYPSAARDPVYLLVFRGDRFAESGCLQQNIEIGRIGAGLRTYKFLSVVVGVASSKPTWILPGAFLSDRSPDLDSLGPVTELGHL